MWIGQIEDFCDTFFESIRTFVGFTHVLYCIIALYAASGNISLSLMCQRAVNVLITGFYRHGEPQGSPTISVLMVKTRHHCWQLLNVVGYPFHMQIILPLKFQGI